MYQINYLPQNSMVYIHTGAFGKNQLIAGRVISTFLLMRCGHKSCTFVNTNYGIVKLSTKNDRTVLFKTPGTDEDMTRNDSYHDCSLYSTIENYRAGVKLGFSSATAPIDVYGLSYVDGSGEKYRYFNVFGFYTAPDGVKKTSHTIYIMKYDENNNRLLPTRSLTHIDRDTNVVERLSYAKSKKDLLYDLEGNFCKRNHKMYATKEEAQREFDESLEIVGLDGDIMVEPPHEPTIKDKLQEFVEQQGTSLEMLKTIIDEMP